VNVYGNSYSWWINPCKIESKKNSWEGFFNLTSWNIVNKFPKRRPSLVETHFVKVPLVEVQLTNCILIWFRIENKIHKTYAWLIPHLVSLFFIHYHEFGMFLHRTSARFSQNLSTYKYRGLSPWLKCSLITHLISPLHNQSL
jgi:hypothetical protein